MGRHLGVRADPEPAPVLTTAGIFFICLTCVWTVLVVAGMSYLIVRRHTPLLRIRGLYLSLSAITLLHLYWISVQLGITIGPLAPAQAEYWVMGIYFPFGIALFHASNSRFLHVAKAQKKYAQHGSSVAKGPSKARCTGGILGHFRRLDYTSKILLVVGLGMLFQLFITILMYVISRKFHRSWGIAGTEVNGTEMEQKMAMGRGWEWWPSVFWQFFWAWLVAPYILWKARGIHDTQGWRFQTVACAVANLHATPMWVIALYVPAMAPVNQYWVPPQWLAVSIMMMEIFTVFLPCWEVMRSQALRQETLESIAHWEAKNKASGHGAKSLHSATTAVESMMSGRKSTTNASVRTSDSGESILTMSALEHVLERNPGPLQQFSALRDFSGENIAFLTSVAEWKNSLPAAARNSTHGSQDQQTRELVRERFNRALRIYAGFISTRDAEFPINISSQDLKKLEGTFESSARILYGDKCEVDPATPFDMPELSPKASTTPTSSCGGSEKAVVATSEDGSAVGDRVQFWGEVPGSFDETVFDDAEKSIKYLVLTNTWPKFVRSRRTSMDTFDMEAGNNAV
ncbi:Regulator of G protein signaling superfamily [Hirsutella rhossiliensis]|uniref:Regulator of G protein signaling superfamily n=1 Tax=Hirsutella rhossiliensis TaxID=111463 RepID=A0A9P8SN01_9HYPO|nr:Regulator of G protein signaling superfamily [Hirsutella rhossiliensis]KAH0967385.1 Regulator of G protein signaling superfamily [Hirsutella rhossiliensis]